MIKIPKDWEKKTLNDLGNLSKGSGISGKQMKSNGIPCIGYGDIYTKYDIKFCVSQNFTDENAIKESVSINKGTLLFTATGETAEEIGKCVCYYGEEPIYVGGDIFILPVNDIDPFFVAYQQNLFPFIKEKARLGQGHSVVHIRSEDIKKLSVVYPKNLSEQKKITKILTKWDDAIELQEQLIGKLELQKKALMQELLKPKKYWKKYFLAELVKINTGNKDVKDSNKDGIYPFFIRSEEIQKINEYTFDGEGIFIPGDGKIGEILHYYEGKCSYHQRVYCLSNFKNCYGKYIYYYLRENFLKRALMFTAKATVDSIRMEMLTKMTIFLPSTEAQKCIINILTFADAKIDLHTQKLTLLKLQRKSLMQHLLTGKTRVKP